MPTLMNSSGNSMPPPPAAPKGTGNENSLLVPRSLFPFPYSPRGLKIPKELV